MSLIYCADASRAPWLTWGAQCSIDNTPGVDAIKSDLNVAAAVGKFSDWHRGDSANVFRSSEGVQHTMYKLEISVWPTGDIAYIGPYNDYALGTDPFCFGIENGTGHLILYDATKTEITDSGWSPTAATNYQMYVEWSEDDFTVKAYIWDGSAWSLKINYSHGSTLHNSTLFKFSWGADHFKGAGIISVFWSWDVVWWDDGGTTCNEASLGPAEVYGQFPDNDGTETDWTASAGNPEDCVDEAETAATNYNDDTDYIHAGVALSTKVVHTFTLTATGAPGAKPIQGVSYGQRAHLDPSGANGTLAWYIIADSTVDEPALGQQPNSWLRNGISEERTPAGNKWTTALLDAMEVGISRSSEASDPYDSRCTGFVVCAVEMDFASDARPWVFVC